ncbi:MAG: ABC transporter permease [Micrococcaceae bacterium]
MKRNELTLALINAKYLLVESIRVPSSLVLGVLSPVIIFMLFVLPNPSMRENPELAARATVALSLFGVLSNSIFNVAINTAQLYESQWGSYLRTLPMKPGPKILGYFISSIALASLTVCLIFCVSKLSTALSLNVIGIFCTVLTILLCSVPFMGLGLIVGCLTVPKTAIALSQLIMMFLAFIGGLLMPTIMFSETANKLSVVTPARQALELSLYAGGVTHDFPTDKFLGLFVWTIIFTLGAGYFHHLINIKKLK